MSSTVSNHFSATPVLWLKLLLVACMLYVTAIVPRVLDTLDQEVQADEIHWQSRSFTLLKALNPPGVTGVEGRRSHFSDHIGHPGIPPAIVMAIGEYLGDLFNQARGLEFGQEGYVDHLAASRLANVLVSSLVVPVVFILGTLILGVVPAGLAAALLLFDPIHIGLSRMAHLDSMLTLFVTGSVLLFALADKRNSLVLHACAGVSWGLATASKPTAVALVIGFLLYRILSPMLSVGHGAEKRRIFLWRDVWAVLFGQAVLLCLFTRLWVHPSQYLGRLRVESFVADLLYSLGIKLQGFMSPSYILPFGLILCAIVLGVVARTAKGRVEFHLSMGGVIVFVLLALMSIAPPLLENLVRFWGWVAGLSNEVHLAYGKTIEPPKYGYAAIVLSRLSEVLLVGLVVALVIWRPWKRLDSAEDRQLGAFILLGVSVGVCWVLLLGISDKQTIRYVLPVFPILYLMAAVGLTGVLNALMLRLAPLRCGVSPVNLLFAFVVAVQAWTSFGWHPAYSLYHNSFSGGLASAIEEGREMPFVGQAQVLRYLHEKAEEEGTTFRVRIVGDVNTFRYTYRRLYPEQEKLLHFPTDRGPAWGCYVVDFPAFQKGHTNRLRDEINETSATLEYSFVQNGHALANLYRVPFADLSQAVEFGVERFVHRIGRIVEGRNGVKQVEVYPTSKRGYIATGILLNVDVGEYTIEPLVELSEHPDLKQWVEANEPVVAVDTSSVCERKIHAQEFAVGSSPGPVLRCDISKPRLIRLNVFWLGKVPIRFSGIRLQRVATTIGTTQHS